jgi:hypothetical protein
MAYYLKPISLATFNLGFSGLRKERFKALSRALQLHIKILCENLLDNDYFQNIGDVYMTERRIYKSWSWE